MIGIRKVKRDTGSSVIQGGPFIDGRLVCAPSREKIALDFFFNISEKC